MVTSFSVTSSTSRSDAATSPAVRNSRNFRWPVDRQEIQTCWDWNYFVALQLMEKIRRSPVDIWIYLVNISVFTVFFTSQVVVWDLWTINSIHHVWRELGMRSAMICLPRNHRCQWQRCLGIWGPRTASFLYLMLTWCKLMFFSLLHQTLELQIINLHPFAKSAFLFCFFWDILYQTPWNETPMAVAPTSVGCFYPSMDVSGALSTF